MNCKFVKPFKSAHSNICKISTLVQECIRRNLRTSMLESYETRNNIMSEFAMKLYRSGYPEHVRIKIMSKAISIYENKLRNVMITNDTSLYRDPKVTKIIYRTKNKNIDWCTNIVKKKLKDDFRPQEKIIAPLIINQNENREYVIKLKNILKVAKDELNLNISLFERGGIKLKNDIKQNPTGSNICLRKNCDLCTDNKNKLCTKNNVGYEKHCIICEQNDVKAVYYGETGKNIFTRDFGHKRDIKAEDIDTPLVKHNFYVHNDTKNIQFKTIINQSFKSSLERANNETITIRLSEAKYILNSRSEFIQPSVPRQITKIGLD